MSEMMTQRGHRLFSSLSKTLVGLVPESLEPCRFVRCASALASVTKRSMFHTKQYLRLRKKSHNKRQANDNKVDFIILLCHEKQWKGKDGTLCHA